MYEAGLNDLFTFEHHYDNIAIDITNNSQIFKFDISIKNYANILPLPNSSIRSRIFMKEGNICLTILMK